MGSSGILRVVQTVTVTAVRVKLVLGVERLAIEVGVKFVLGFERLAMEVGVKLVLGFERLAIVVGVGSWI